MDMIADKSKDYDRLNKECFWEYSFSIDDIDRLFVDGSTSEKSFLFEKILANSTDLLNDMELFDLEELQILVDNYQVPKFNFDYLSRRKNIIEYYFLDRPLEIQELKWVA